MIYIVLFLLAPFVGELLLSPSIAHGAKIADAKVVTKTRDMYTVVFQAVEDQSLTTTELTEAEYLALDDVDAAPPPQVGLPGGKTWVFVSASKNDEYDTPSGLLEEGNIYVTATDIFVILTSNREMRSLNRSTYEVTNSGLGTAAIAPNPPGLTIDAGEVWEE